MTALPKEVSRREHLVECAVLYENTKLKREKEVPKSTGPIEYRPNALAKRVFTYAFAFMLCC